MKKINCLVIDPDSNVALSLMQMDFISKNLDSVSLEHVESIIEAKKKLQNKIFQIIFLESFIDKINSTEFIKHINRLAPFSKIIVISKNYSYESIRNAFLNGADDYLTKPIDEKKFADSIQTIINNFKIENTTSNIAKFIADDIIHDKAISESLLKKYHDEYLGLNNFDNIPAQKYITAIFFILEELPKYSLDINNSFLAKISAEWIIEETNQFEAFKYSIYKIKTAYNHLFFPQIKSSIVRKAIEEVLAPSAEIKTVSYIAKKLFINQSYLSVTFKTDTGISLSKYISRVKMYGAMLLMLNIDLDLHKIMNILGYKDERHFNRNFKIHCGMSVFEYSQKYKKYKFNS